MSATSSSHLISGFSPGSHNDPEYHKPIIEARKNALIQALIKNNGLINLACKSVGVTRQTFWHYMAADPEFKEIYEIIKEEQQDKVENKMFELIDQGDSKLIMFYLSCIAKARGYCYRSGDTNVNVGVNTDDKQTTINIIQVNDKKDLDKLNGSEGN